MSGRYGHVPRTESPYEVLGLSRHGALKYTDQDIAKAYRKASLNAHPDKPNGSIQKFDRITSAYELVKTAELRQKFHQYGSRLVPGAGEALGEAVDKLGPLVLGMAGGVLEAVSFWRFPVTNVLVAVPIVFVGLGPSISTRAPVTEILRTGTSGLVLGAGLGSIACGMVWSFSRLFQRR